MQKNYIQLLILDNQLDLATRVNDSLLSRQPKDVDGMVLRGQILSAQGRPNEAIQSLEAALKDDPSVFSHSNTSTNKILDAAEYAANLLEAAEMVPMYEPPTAKIKFWREQPEAKRDRLAIRSFAYDLGLTLKKYCQIY